jgi:hypothetical protein
MGHTRRDQHISTCCCEERLRPDQTILQARCPIDLCISLPPSRTTRPSCWNKHLIDLASSPTAFSRFLASSPGWSTRNFPKVKYLDITRLAHPHESLRNNCASKMGRQPATKRSKAIKASVMHTPDASAPRDKAVVSTPALRRGVRHRRSGAQEHVEEEGLLPPELLQLVGATLEASELAAASLVCRLWSRSLRGGGPGQQTTVPCPWPGPC